ncbi:MAG TPA: Crp/Fnr family transcriptional regulator [Ohtaekwangia sp.]
MYTPLLNHIRKYISVDDEEEKLLLSLAQFREVRNKEFLLEAGQVCSANYFVCDGCFRMYLNTDYGTEQIIQFGINNWWISDYTSFESQRPSELFIQAVEKSSIVILEKPSQDELLKQIPQLERYFRLIFQRAYSAQLSRIHFMMNFSGEERYHHLRNAFPDFVQRVPQFMLASYLGFTPEFLSKIRGKKS